MKVKEYSKTPQNANKWNILYYSVYFYGIYSITAFTFNINTEN